MLMEMQLVRKLTSLYNVIMLAYHLLLFKGTENWFVKKNDNKSHFYMHFV